MSKALSIWKYFNISFFLSNSFITFTWQLLSGCRWYCLSPTSLYFKTLCNFCRFTIYPNPSSVSTRMWLFHRLLSVSSCWVFYNLWSSFIFVCPQNSNSLVNILFASIFLKSQRQWFSRDTSFGQHLCCIKLLFLCEEIAQYLRFIERNILFCLSVHWLHYWRLKDLDFVCLKEKYLGISFRFYRRTVRRYNISQIVHCMCVVFKNRP